MTTFTIQPTGLFSLQEMAEFGFGQRAAQRYDGVLRLAFCLDGLTEQVGVAVRQDDAGVHGVVSGSGDVTAVRRQVARALSLDHDGDEFARVGERDPVVGRLMAVAPGLRPPLFYSPYEAAIWSVLSARRPARQMSEVRRLLSEAYGATFEVAGTSVSALPTPDRLLALTEFPGILERKLTQMHAIARAALDGRLAVERLTTLGPEAAQVDLQTLPGIGPFYSSLIVIRATGFADVLPREERTLLGLLAGLYGLPAAATPADLDGISEVWRPFRTWTSVLVRAASSRLPSA